MVGFYGTGGGGGDLTLIGEQTLAQAGTVTFSDIPQTYRDLILTIWHPAGGTARNCAVQFNGDTGSNYVGHRGRFQTSAANASVFTAQNSAYVGIVQGNSPGITEVVIPNYADDGSKKVLMSRSAAELTSGAWEQAFFTFVWTGTDPITSLKVDATGLDLASGTIVTLYGRGSVA